MGEHRRGDAADRNEAQDRDRESSHFQVQIDGIHHSRSTSRRKTVREARVRTAAIVERDARMGGGCLSRVQPLLGVFTAARAPRHRRDRHIGTPIRLCHNRALRTRLALGVRNTNL